MLTLPSPCYKYDTILLNEQFLHVAFGLPLHKLRDSTQAHVLQPLSTAS